MMPPAMAIAASLAAKIVIRRKRKRRQHVIVGLVGKEQRTEDDRSDADDEHRHGDHQQRVRLERPQVRVGIRESAEVRVLSKEDPREENAGDEHHRDQAGDGAAKIVRAEVGQQRRREQNADEVARERAERPAHHDAVVASRIAVTRDR